ncbi:hypothetical protein [Roseomonas indoligenes]|uniref:Uncharacterized protein n=1 Tax=Roseomonas indoligenes TaxID=2820811 RepID=A0A940MVY7_9PROT|nr:hypothetical protein [Pararoseomonas indoligenes]MBP0491985.1 hypothetical protein [Pararoseomonas indoligenes]
MRWIFGAFFVAAFASLASTGHAVTPGAATASVESAREAVSATQDVAYRRNHHRRPRHHRHVMPR